MSAADDSRRILLWHGMFLFLLGLLTGFAETSFANMRMGLAAHLEGVMNGTFLLALGAVDDALRPTPRIKAFTYWVTLYGTYANWLFTTLAAVFGTGALFGLLGILFLRRLPTPRRNESRVEEVPLRQALGLPLRDHSFRQFLAFSSAWSFTSGFMAPFYMVYMLRELRLSFFVVSALTALTNIIMSATQVHWGRLGDHFGTKPVLRIGSYLIVLAPMAWLFTSPRHVWPVIIVQVVSGLGWSAFHVSQGNLALKLSPENKRPSYLGTFGAASGAAEAIAPIIGGAILATAQGAGLASVTTYKALMLVQLVLYSAATILPRRIHEPGGHAVGHLIRVMARFRAMDASEPAKLVFEYGYFHLARLADLIAREYPRDAETI